MKIQVYFWGFMVSGTAALSGAFAMADKNPNWLMLLSMWLLHASAMFHFITEVRK